MNFLDNHKHLFTVAFLFFLVLTILVAILPAIHNQNNNAPLPGYEALSEEATKGKALFVANGCVACHSQQVRNIDMDKVWGERPSISADYAGIKRMDVWRNTATLMGTERTGPDLTNIGNRQPSMDWNLVHLYNPRIVVKESIMPSYPWLFEYKGVAADDDIVVNIPEQYKNGGKGVLVAKPDALYLVAYLQSLKQLALPESLPAPDFLYKKSSTSSDNKEGGEELDGAALYVAHCQSCHQANGEGLPGAFPPLKGSSIVNGDNLELYIDIIMNGYDARPEYGPMAAVGVNAGFTEHEVSAIINYERTSWGNSGETVLPEDIKSIVDFVRLQAE